MSWPGCSFSVLLTCLHSMLQQLLQSVARAVHDIVLVHIGWQFIATRVTGITMCMCVADGEAGERTKALNMMRMLASRQNAKWVEGQEWDVPYTFDATKFPTLLGTAHSSFAVCKCDVCRGSRMQPTQGMRRWLLSRTASILCIPYHGQKPTCCPCKVCSLLPYLWRLHKPC